MIGLNETGGAATPPETSRDSAPGQFGRYHGPAHPGKTVAFNIDGTMTKIKGKVAAFMQALIAAGGEGVAHVEVMPWMHNASDAAMQLKRKGVRIDTRKGKPTRWVLRSEVREVLP